jgi:hypothetical protein
MSAGGYGVGAKWSCTVDCMNINNTLPDVSAMGMKNVVIVG